MINKIVFMIYLISHLSYLIKSISLILLYFIFLLMQSSSTRAYAFRVVAISNPTLSPISTLAPTQPPTPAPTPSPSPTQYQLYLHEKFHLLFLLQKVSPLALHLSLLLLWCSLVPLHLLLCLRLVLASRVD